MNQHNKRKPHPKPIMANDEEIKVINEKGEVIHTATLTPELPGQAFFVVSKTWMYQTGTLPADVAALAVQGFAAALQSWVSTLYEIDPARADAVMDALDAETGG
jgi:hypothetical protein